VIKLTAVITEAHHYHQLHTKILSNILPTSLTPHSDEISGDHQCGFWENKSTIDRIPISGRYWRKNGSIKVQYISYLQISRKPIIQLGGNYYTIL
jgi:hypothetical protein